MEIHEKALEPFLLIATQSLFDPLIGFAANGLILGPKLLGENTVTFRTLADDGLDDPLLFNIKIKITRETFDDVTRRPLDSGNRRSNPILEKIMRDRARDPS